MTSTESVPRQALTVTELQEIDRYWRAANYLSVGQIYLQDNPLLREPLVPEHIKPRLLGHWGTTPGLNFIYAHLNHQIRSRGTEMMWIVGPGHGGPSPVATAWLDGVYSQIYPDVGRNAEGMRRLFRQFSFPGGVPSHAAPETPGSIHEGGELGYALAHAFGAAFDNPDLVVAAVVGDGEAETGALSGSWQSIRFLNPARDGAVLPILHLNGYKIAGPTVLARIPEEDLLAQMRGHGYEPHVVAGDDPDTVHQLMAGLSRAAWNASTRSGSVPGRRTGTSQRALAHDHPAHPKGWTGPAPWTENPWKTRGVPPGAACCHAGEPGTCACWRSGCAATVRRSCSTSTAHPARGPRRWCPRRTAGSAAARTPTGACCCVTSSCRTSGTTPSR